MIASIEVNNQSLVPPIEPERHAPSELTSYAESAPEVHTETPTQGASLDIISNPYPEQDIEKILSRDYKVAEYTWDPSDPTGTLLGIASFPVLLQQIPNIADKLAQFEWLRSDVEVTVKVNSTKFHIGSLNLSWLPHTRTNPDMAYPEQRLNTNATVMSLSSVNSATIKIPRCGPRNWDQAHDTGDGQIGSLWVDVLDPLLISSNSTPSPLKVVLFAHFVNPKVAGYGVTPLSPARMQKYVQRFTKERTEKHSKRLPSNKEGVEKSKGGVISGIAEAAGNFAPILAASPLAEFAPFAALAGAAAPFLRSLGLCKPQNVQSLTPVFNDAFRDHTYGHGLEDGKKLSLHPEALLSDTNLSLLKRHSIQEIAGTPSHIFAGVIDSSTSPSTPFMHFPVTPGLCKWNSSGKYFYSYMAYMSLFFNRWRGSLKFHMKFVTSEFTTARIRILHYPNEELPADVEDYAGDTPNTVIDIRGNTDFSFSVPFISPWTYLPIAGPYSPDDTTEGKAQAVPYTAPWIAFSLLNPVTIPDPSGNSTIYYHIYVSAGDDLEFGQFTGPCFRPTGFIPPPESTLINKLKLNPLKTKEKTEKHSLKEVFQKPFKPLVPATAQTETGLVLPEKYSSIEALMKRWQRINELPEFCYIQDTNTTGNTVRLMLNLFQWYRGGLRFKVRYDSDGSYRSVYYYPEFNNQSEMESPMIPDSAIHNIETPWDSNTYLRPLYNEYPEDGFAFPANHLFHSSASASCWMAVAEDFVFGSLKSPPPRVVIEEDLSHYVTLKKRNVQKVAAEATSDDPSVSSGISSISKYLDA